jgi:16S rRNA (cytidine1402-2'-O)-methyltransferase
VPGESGEQVWGGRFEVRPGVLYLVPTPIGNLRDITLRALDVLAGASLIAAEDTRRTGQLLKLLGIGRRGRMLSYHQHNEARRCPEVVSELRAGGSVALVSNAGTPLISDPGHRLVRAVLEAGLRVEPLPGPSAVTAALAAAGLPNDSFCFLGFVPRKPGARSRLLAAAAERAETVVFFESPARLSRTLGEAAELFGAGRQAAVGRELTKLHEEFVRATLGELADRYRNRAPRGEITVLIAGCDRQARGAQSSDPA